MALPSTVYRATIQLADVDRGIYETLPATLARHPSETAERLVLRLLAYAVCYAPELSFTKGVGAGDEPDLWVRGGDNRVALWVEVGAPEPERLLKAARHARRVVLLASAPNRFRWDGQHLGRLAGVPNITVVGLDFVLVRELAARLDRTIAWNVTVNGGTLYVTAAGATLDAPLELLAGPPLGED
ncbi:MAG TPA: YaeQ family protein [Geobacteraceae bacterium]